MQTLASTKNRLIKPLLRRSIPLRLIVVVPFMLQIFAVVGLVGYLSYPV